MEKCKFEIRRYPREVCEQEATCRTHIPLCSNHAHHFTMLGYRVTPLRIDRTTIVVESEG